ncbi:hypothetical protein PIB30_024248 [Stylosanthes scabra]|uniref:Uncharacterized protein n=1 Tax=Stylosanthes scabra TaxID=79078 RepID=A0ABU6T9F5_9FABA|nr:hypothetical protein [Stylosanthes scabra]
MATCHGSHLDISHSESVEGDLKPVRIWGIYRHKYTCSGGGGKVHVLRFRSRAQEQAPILLWRKDRASPYPCCARQIGSLLIGRVGSVFSSGRRIWTPLGPVEGVGPTLFAVNGGLPKLQVGGARLVLDKSDVLATCVENMGLAYVLASIGVLDPPLLGRTQILSLGLVNGYEHCPYAGLWSFNHHTARNRLRSGT